MKTLLSTAALSLALAVPALAQDARPTIPVNPPVAQAPAPAPQAVPPAVKVEPPKAQAPAPQAPAAKVEPAKPAQPAAAATPAKVEPKADAKATVKLVNINKATAAELDVLPKIGEARSKAIIAGRPYKSVDELITRKVLPQDAFDAIKAKVSVK